MGIRSWNRGQFIVFLCAALFCEVFLTWKYQDIANQLKNDQEVMMMAMQNQANLTRLGVSDDSTKRMLGSLIDNTISEEWRAQDEHRLILFVGGVIIPVVILLVAWRWASRKPLTA